jgi:hypothetical protein
MKRWLLLTGAAFPAILAGLGLGVKPHGLWIPYWPLSQRTIYDCSTSSWPGLKNPTPEELAAFNRAIACQNPPPPGFTLDGPPQHVVARTTGVVNWLGRHQVQVKVTNGGRALASAKLYLAYELVSEATLDNGAIVDRAEGSEVTLDLFLPWIPHFTLALITEGRDGKLEESSLSIGRSSLNPK